MCYAHCETDPRCSIQAVPEAIGYDAFVLKRKDEMYGTLELTRGYCVVRHKEIPILKAEAPWFTWIL